MAANLTRVPLDASANESSPKLRQLLKWWLLCVLILREVALKHLRDMMALHTHVKYCAWYWHSAVDHSRTTLAHQLLSGNRASWRYLWQGAARCLQASRRDVVLRVDTLRRMEAFMVRRIGSVYHALESLNNNIDALARCRSPVEIGSRGSSDSVADIAGGMDASMSPDMDASENVCELLESLSRTCLVVIPMMALKGSYEESSASGEFEKDASPSSAHVPPTASSAHLGHPSLRVPRVESVAFGEPSFSLDECAASPSGGSDDCASDGELSRAEFTLRCRARRAAHMLRLVDEGHRRWADHWEQYLVSHCSPPIGRYWRRACIAIAVAVPCARAALTMTIDDAKAACTSLWRFGSYVYEWYIAEPARNLHRSLFAPREGVMERRRVLQRDTESLAKIVEDYHRECCLTVSDDPVQLAAIHANAVHGDYGLVRQHLEEAIRHPIKGFFVGNLVRLALIQVQQMELDVSRVLASFDEVLQTNDVNFRLMALGPFVCVSVGVATYVMLQRKKKRRPAVLQMRLLWRALHRIVCASQQHDDGAATGPCRSFPSHAYPNPEQQHVACSNSSENRLNDAQQGRVVLAVHQMRTLTEFLADYGLNREFLEDLSDLEATGSSRANRLRTLERMMAVYPFLSAAAM